MTVFFTNTVSLHNRVAACRPLYIKSNQQTHRDSGSVREGSHRSNLRLYERRADTAPECLVSSEQAFHYLHITTLHMHY